VCLINHICIPRIWPNVGSMLLSTKPSEACLIRKPCSTLPLHLETFGPWRIFPECPFLHMSLSEHPLSLRLGTSMFATLILLCNVAFFYSFSSFPTLLKKTKKSNIPQKEEGKSIFFLFGSTMSHPWTKHILPFVLQALGFNTTLGSCSHYIDCVLLCLVILPNIWRVCVASCIVNLCQIPCCLSLIICRAIAQGNFYQA
jgi:hypothetical protein